MMRRRAPCSSRSSRSVEPTTLMCAPRVSANQGRHLGQAVRGLLVVEAGRLAHHGRPSGRVPDFDAAVVVVELLGGHADGAAAGEVVGVERRQHVVHGRRRGRGVGRPAWPLRAAAPTAGRGRAGVAVSVMCRVRVRVAAGRQRASAGFVSSYRQPTIAECFCPAVRIRRAAHRPPLTAKSASRRWRGGRRTRSSGGRRGRRSSAARRRGGRGRGRATPGSARGS